MAAKKKSGLGKIGGGASEPTEQQGTFAELEKRVVWNVDMGSVDQVDQTDAISAGG